MQEQADQQPTTSQPVLDKSALWRRFNWWFWGWLIFAIVSSYLATSLLSQYSQKIHSPYLMPAMQVAYLDWIIYSLFYAALVFFGLVIIISAFIYKYSKNIFLLIISIILGVGALAFTGIYLIPPLIYFATGYGLIYYYKKHAQIPNPPTEKSS